MRRRYGSTVDGPVRVTAVIGGGVAVAAAVVVRVAVGGPLAVLHRLDATAVLPPLWLLGLLWLIGFFVVGAAVGVLAVGPRRGPWREADAFRGCTCLVISLGGALIWYTLLFGKGVVFFSWLCLPIILVPVIPGVGAWGRVSPAATAAAVGWGLWLIALFVGQLAVMLHL